MVLKFYVVAILLISLFSVCLVAQDVEGVGQDGRDTLFLNALKSSDIQITTDDIDTVSVRLKQKFKPDPKKAIIYSAVFPGLGQIYNRKYWKLPIVYGAFIGCSYAISWNGSQYSDYMNAYKDILIIDTENGKPKEGSWNVYVPVTWGNPDDLSASQYQQLTNMLRNKKNYYRRYRDLSYIIAVGVYAFTMIDAYVDAQLFDFDISPDLSMHMEPVIFDRSSTNSRAVGLQCSFKF